MGLFDDVTNNSSVQKYTGFFADPSAYMMGLGQAKIDKATAEEAEARRQNALNALNGYGYQMYESPYKSFYDQFAKTYLNGQLTQAQENALNDANAQGMANINTTFANRGGTIGGQQAMTQKFGENLSKQRTSMVDANQEKGLALANAQDDFNAGQWLAQQNAEMRAKELRSALQ
jgi:hypothetical protein